MIQPLPADSRTCGDAAMPRTQIARIQRCILVAVLILTAIGICWYYTQFVYSRPITRYDQLEENVGKRVTFTTIVNLREYKAYQLVYLDDKPIRFLHKLGGIDWSPEPGEECRVVGFIEHDLKNEWGIQYRLSQAEYFPLGSGSDDESGM